jgi:hypothetical protein
MSASFDNYNDSFYNNINPWLKILVDLGQDQLWVIGTDFFL